MDERDADAVVAMAEHFASRIAYYDCWDDTNIWAIVRHYGEAVRHFLQTGDATKLKLEPGIPDYECYRSDTRLADVRATDILRLWNLLALLPTNYEDICREWFLPTAVGFLADHPHISNWDTFEKILMSPNVARAHALGSF